MTSNRSQVYDMETREGILKFAEEHLTPLRRSIRILDAKIYDDSSLLRPDTIRLYQRLVKQRGQVEKIVKACSNKVSEREEK